MQDMLSFLDLKLEKYKNLDLSFLKNKDLRPTVFFPKIKSINFDEYIFDNFYNVIWERLQFVAFLIR